VKRPARTNVRLQHHTDSRYTSDVVSAGPAPATADHPPEACALHAFIVSTVAS